MIELKGTESVINPSQRSNIYLILRQIIMYDLDGNRDESIFLSVLKKKVDILSK